MNTILNINNLSVDFDTEYGIFHAVDNVSFTVSKGQVVGIVGESGCGKTVTTLAIMRLLDTVVGASIQGEILFEGQDLLSLRKKQMHQIRGNEISMIFQEPMTSLNPILTIGRQITESLELHLKMSSKQAKERAAELLDLVGFSDPYQKLNDYPQQLSGGMRQRVMIAMAISCNPKLIIADEPTTSLDVTIQAQILDLIMDICDKSGAALMLITHNLGLIARYAEKVIVMYSGNIVEEGIANQIYYDSHHPYTLGLLKAVPRIDGDIKKAIDYYRRNASRTNRSVNWMFF
ncbi:MAG: ABC transporter ATP-binding protein [Chloroflexota bacterium]|nr:MAG: ABC transporter ATP-binding protein [Chloroflexota bacterium]